MELSAIPHAYTHRVNVRPIDRREVCQAAKVCYAHPVRVRDAETRRRVNSEA